MTNPTREEIIRAHETLDDLCDCLKMGWSASPASIKASKDTVKKALPPKPFPTMADIEWLESVHYLAEAKHKDGRTVIMLTRDSSTRINFIWNESIDATHPQNLTPTGRMYTLTEVQG
ncbi:hypothetical protein [Corynebacterium simulans]|uniref:hypothetical protein n=1 Tax=Corynebacterium simulans TaxID=146827 RepID=UPI000781922F|nr:hypothetical protein [Corynebacterium simulans]